jgi:N-methylhydantoinase B
MTTAAQPQGPGAVPADRTSGFDPVLLAVMANRLDTIVREMENTLLRSGRSAILNMARDFSCAIITADNRLLASAEGLPVHVIGMEFLSQAMTDLHKDILEGDAYLHNDPYLGNTHPADHVILVPVFIEGKHVFTAAAKAHQADCGNSRPTTYQPYARDVYEEGSLIFPCVLVQRDFHDVEDIIRMCRRRIRVPEQWYGDYLAMVGAARIAENRLKQLCSRYGLETIERFVEEWFDYSERRVAHVISQMPSGTITGHGSHDPFGPAPDGIPINVKVTVDPEAGLVELDLTDNIDCLPAGVNESRTCAMNNCMTGFLNSIDPDIPHNAGTFRRINVKLRENCVVGIPRFPHSCSVATTNVGERLVVTTQRTIADHWPGYGRAEGSCGIGPAFAVVSGTDRRKGHTPYVNQMFLGPQGGPAGPVYDGWITYGNSVTNGLMLRDSIEVDEQKYPLRVKEIRIRTDSGGAGRRRGAPGTICVYGPKRDPMVANYVTDGYRFPPRGTQGGGDGAPSVPYILRTDGTEEPLDPIAQLELKPGELLGHRLSGGGGYGDPLEREVQLVRDDVLARFVSFESARDIYGVVFEEEILGDELRVDQAATERRRQALSDAR